MAHIDCPRCHYEASSIGAEVEWVNDAPRYVIIFHHDAAKFLRKRRTCRVRLDPTAETASIRLFPLARLDRKGGT